VIGSLPRWSLRHGIPAAARVMLVVYDKTSSAVPATIPAAVGLTSDSGRYCLLRHITQPRPGYTSPNLWPDALMDTTLGSWKSLQQQHACGDGTGTGFKM
jgi:hypothetical protein